MEWPLLSDLGAEEARELIKIARRRRFSRNEVVFHRDDPGDSLHLIRTGRFAIRVMTPLGDIAMLAVRGPGESFGEMALIGQEARRSATVTALEEAETIAIYREEFERLRARHPSVDDVLLRFLAKEVRTLNERLLEALYVPVERRVLRRLMELTVIYGGSDPVEIALTQEAIAELTGAARATVNQVLREEEKRGTLELSRGRIRIVDVEALRTRAR